MLSAHARPRRSASLAVLILGLALAPRGHAVLPYGSAPPGSVYDYASQLFIASGDCSEGNASSNDLPASFDCEGDWKLTDHRDTSDPAVAASPQELYGVKGSGLNRAWEITTGRPDVVIAVLDSGIRWEESRPGLLRKHYLNRGELPLPAGAAAPHPVGRFGGYDANRDGVFNVEDYAGDPRVADLNGNGAIDPEDLIRTFSDGVDDDANGYVDDVSGWDFFEDDNNPQDEVDYGHGTGEAEDSAEEAGFGDGTCPNCMVLSLRVGDSFIADVNHFAEAVVYAVDNGAAVIQEALGTLNHTSFGQLAVDYAYANGVMINASAADEAAGHHNWPAAYEHTMMVNSIRLSGVEATPASHLYLNGCTNFGGYAFTAIPSSSCSSEATGRSAGVTGLLISAARNAVERGHMSPYVRDDGSLAPYALSAEEAMQLWRLAADDIDFSTPHPEHAFSAFAPAGVTPVAAANQFETEALEPLIRSERYHTVRGWDYFTGYGRASYARLVRYVGLEGVPGVPDREYLPGGDPYAVGEDAQLQAQDRIPPEADISAPTWWQPHAYREDHSLLLPDDPASPAVVVVRGRAAANRVTLAGGSFEYALEWAPHVQGRLHDADPGPAAAGSEERSAGPWTEAARVSGLTHAVEGELGRIPVAELAAALAANANPFDPLDDPTSPFQPERFAIRLRLRVIAHPADPADTLNNEAVFQKQIDVYPARESLLRADLGASGRRAGGTASPSFHDLDGDGRDELLLPTSDGVVHAYTDVAAGNELPGWPVHTDVYPGIRSSGDNAFTRGDLPADVYGSVLVGTAVAADLDRDGTLEVAVADLEGKLYVWEHDGGLRPGFPVSVDRSLTKQVGCGPATIPACDDYEEEPPKRDRWNTRDWGIGAAPAAGDLDPVAPGLELVSGAADGHVYAFRADGTPVPGWPVILRDPAKVAAMDPATRFVTYTVDANPALGTKVVTTPSLGDLDGDGDLEVVIGVNEEYAEPLNVSLLGDVLASILVASGSGGNTRFYALHHTGSASVETAESAATVHPHDQAYLPGWPFRGALLALDVLPTVGAGTDSQLPLADIDGDGSLEIVAASVLGPAYVLDHDGTSFYGASGTFPNTLAFLPLAFGPGSEALDGSSMVGLAALSVGSLDGGIHLTVAGGASGLRRLVDIQLEARQIDAEDHLALWNATTGAFEPNAPLIVNDLQFFASPTIADVTGDGLAEAIQGTAVSDTVVAGLDDSDATARRLFHGGWQIGSSSVGRAPLDADVLQLATVTREGYLRLYPTQVPASGPAACAATTEWPEYGHDAFNSGHYGTDAERPYPVADLVATMNAGLGITLEFTASGDDRDCGTVAGYEVRQLEAGMGAEWDAAAPLGAAPAAEPRPPGGQPDTWLTDPLPNGDYTVLVRAVDDAGLVSAPRAAPVHISDADGDGDAVPDLLDNCPALSNATQADAGGVQGPAPDGVGDGCQCGDVDDDGRVALRDVVVGRRARSGLGPGIDAPGKCNTTGPASDAGPDALGVTPDCEGVDLERVRRALAGLVPGIEPVCRGM